MASTTDQATPGSPGPTPGVSAGFDSPDPATRDPRLRPITWRLPLVVMLIVGALTLRHVDGILQREYQTEAGTQAVQTDALLESFVKQRVALLGGLRGFIATMPANRAAEQGFERLSAEALRDAPDLLAIYLLDSTGTATHAYRRDERGDVANRHRNHFAFPNRARALLRANRSRGAALTTTVQLADGSRGMIAYTPVIREERIVGYVGASLAYGALFNDALAGQLRGHFAYRLLDEAGTVIAMSPEYPDDPARRLTSDVSLPGGVRWTLEVAIPRNQPFTPRLITWIVGLLLLGLLASLVLREEARARRSAAHTHDLELLTRGLLDANTRLEERAQQIAEANRGKSRFLANVSHELRTPLNAIVGYNSLALDGLYGPLPQPLQTAHERIGAAAEHLLGLVNDVLDLSKIEAGRLEVHPEPLSLEGVLDSVLTVIEPIAEAKGLRIDLIVERKLPQLITDPRHLRQILLNFVANAVKFTERGSVTITARRLTDDPSRVRVVVEDTGIGIADDDLERIFEEFEQVRPSGRGDSIQRGAGLGLAIARKLARLLGATVQVDSVLGSGSRFTLDLPIEISPQLAAAGNSSEWTPAEPHPVSAVPIVNDTREPSDDEQPPTAQRLDAEAASG